MLYQESGVRGFYVGYLATLMRNVPSTALKFMLYEEIKVLFLSFTQRNDLNTPEHLMAGGLAGLMSSFATTPMDVRIKSDI